MDGANGSYQAMLISSCIKWSKKWITPTITFTVLVALLALIFIRITGPHISNSETLPQQQKTGMRKCMHTYTVYGKTFKGENFCSFSLNHKCFPTNYGLVDWQCKSTSMLA